jgi:hypothetical protein
MLNCDYLDYHSSSGYIIRLALTGFWLGIKTDQGGR